MGLLEEESNHVGHHACLGGFFGDRVRVIEYAMMTISAMVLAVTNWGNLVPLETRQSPYVAAMATAAFEAFLVSRSNLTSIACGNGGPNCYTCSPRSKSLSLNIE